VRDAPTRAVEDVEVGHVTDRHRRPRDLRVDEEPFRTERDDEDRQQGTNDWPEQQDRRPGQSPRAQPLV
jgi:hypothetical protein